jgi:hypothetical protein
VTELASTHSDSQKPQQTTRAIPGWFWAVLFIGLSIYVANRMDAFDWFANVELPGGVTERLAVGYASVDHPFHATRAETLRRSLADGELLRWIGNHQGGYPVEFYPLGVAWLEVGIWAVLFGSLPIIVVHKLTIVLVFLLPGLAFVFFCRRDRLTPGIALLAFAGHVAVGAWWWSGGYMELALWGLVTNVAANVALLFVLPSLTGYLKWDERRAGATGALFAAFAIVTNPRSLIALATICAGVVIAIVIERIRADWRAGDLAKRLIVVLGIAALLAAPELISLLRFSDLYYFVHYSGYADLSAYLDSSVQAVSGPIFVLAVLGTLFGLIVPGRTLTRGVAITLVLYAALTAYLSTDAAAKTLVDQLETTRLMPFQRYLMLFLAAVGVYDVLGWLSKLVAPASKLAIDVGLAGLSALVMLLYVVSPPDFIPDGDRGLYEIPSTVRPAMVDLETAVKLADSSAMPGTALLVLGTDLSDPSSLTWHDGLWSPMWSDRPFFYDDWLWYWQKKHFGEYNPETEHAYPRDDSALSEEYLQHHGIGAVVVTGEARDAAADSPLIEVVQRGAHDVYVVREPTTIVTFDDQNSTAFDYTNEEISATGEGSGGTATIRRNWFPRWSAAVNGEGVPISETDDGYMTVPIPEGQTALELNYLADGWDWLARLLSAAGFAAVVFLLLPRRWFKGRARAASKVTALC